MGPGGVPPLLDAEGFLAELERLEYLKKRPTVAKPLPGSHPAASGFDETARHRAHDALERALEPEYHRQQYPQSDTHIGEQPPGQMPRSLVAFVLILGLIAGAAVAGVMFYDRVALFVVERIHLR